MTPSATKFSFAVVADEATRVLILGSLPGEASLRQGEYYAHRRNQVWRLMERVTERDLVGLSYADRLATLLLAGVGLWDVIHSAERVGSLDADIRRATANGLTTFVAALPSLRAIGFNGVTASVIGSRQLGVDPGPDLLTLPSSSPARAIPFGHKQAAWRKMNPYLGPPR